VNEPFLFYMIIKMQLPYLIHNNHKRNTIKTFTKPDIIVYPLKMDAIIA